MTCLQVCEACRGPREHPTPHDHAVQAVEPVLRKASRRMLLLDAAAQCLACGTAL